MKFDPSIGCDICGVAITDDNHGFSNDHTLLCLDCTNKVAERAREVDEGTADQPIYVEGS